MTQPAQRPSGVRALLQPLNQIDRRGSPQTLVCTKTRASYQAKVEQHHLDGKHLAEMRALGEEI